MAEVASQQTQETSTPEQGSAGNGKKQKGRPTTYTPELAAEICAQLAEGLSLRKVCESKKMPAVSTIFLWMRDHDEFSEQYARAKDEAADALADDIQDIADKVLTKKYDPNAARVAIDGKKWVASKLKPKKYSDRLDLTTGGDKINRGMSDAELNAILARDGGPATNQTGQSSQT